MVELFFVVNDSIAGEITDQKGVIHHDGWSKDGVHYVGLLATYPVKTDKITSAGEAIMEPVTSALAFSPLPKADYKGNVTFVSLWKPLHLIHNHTTNDDLFDL